MRYSLRDLFWLTFATACFLIGYMRPVGRQTPQPLPLTEAVHLSDFLRHVEVYKQDTVNDPRLLLWFDGKWRPMRGGISKVPNVNAVAVECLENPIAVD